jgi:aminopeptidase N
MVQKTLGLVLLGSLCCAPRPPRTRSVSPAKVVTAAPDEMVRVEPKPRGVLDILSYDTRLRVDVRSRSVEGKTTITYALPESARSILHLPSHGLDIRDVSSLGSPLKFQIDAEEIVLDLPRPVQEGEQAAIEIVYRGKPARGLVFGDALVYTDFFTCHWMPCLDSPDDRAAFRLELVVPAAYRVIAGGEHLGSAQAGAGQMEHVYFEKAPRPTYLFGFAAGKFVEATQREGGVELSFLGPGPAAALQRLFEPTAGMLRFFESKAGVPLPGGRYAQVLVPGSQAQEKSSFSLIGTEELGPSLKDPSEDWVIAHELAHQWWGNLITCKDFSHFWLNEGVTSFMVAAYKEQRWGAAAYARELELFDKRHQAAVAQGFDPKLTFAGDYPTLEMRRAITYSKAALFLSQLRRELGDDAFWRGMKSYTQTRANQSVVSRDFQHDFEAASGRNLTALFNAWVYD